MKVCKFEPHLSLETLFPVLKMTQNLLHKSEYLFS